MPKEPDKPTRIIATVDKPPMFKAKGSIFRTVVKKAAQTTPKA